MCSAYRRHGLLKQSILFVMGFTLFFLGPKILVRISLALALWLRLGVAGGYTDSFNIQIELLLLDSEAAPAKLLSSVRTHRTT